MAIDSSDLVEIKPYSMKQLCKIYEVKNKTMQKWIKSIHNELGNRHGHTYNTTQVAIIFNRFGNPRKPKKN